MNGSKTRVPNGGPEKMIPMDELERELSRFSAIADECMDDIIFDASLRDKILSGCRAAPPAKKVKFWNSKRGPIMSVVAVAAAAVFMFGLSLRDQIFNPARPQSQVAPSSVAPQEEKMTVEFAVQDSEDQELPNETSMMQEPNAAPDGSGAADSAPAPTGSAALKSGVAATPDQSGDPSQPPAPKSEASTKTAAPPKTEAPPKAEATAKGGKSTKSVAKATNKPTDKASETQSSKTSEQTATESPESESTEHGKADDPIFMMMLPQSTQQPPPDTADQSAPKDTQSEERSVSEEAQVSLNDGDVESAPKVLIEVGKTYKYKTYEEAEKAGFSLSAPGYIPAGISLSSINIYIDERFGAQYTLNYSGNGARLKIMARNSLRATDKTVDLGANPGYLSVDGDTASVEWEDVDGVWKVLYTSKSSDREDVAVKVAIGFAKS